MVSSVSLQTPARRSDYTSNASTSAALPVTAPAREQELSRQLDERLTSEITRIRRQISPENRPAPSSSEGIGTILDIRA